MERLSDSSVRSYSSQYILTKLWHNKAFSDFHNLDEAAHSHITFQHVQWDEVPELTLQPAGNVQMIVSGCGSKKSLRMRETIHRVAAMLGMAVEDVHVVLMTTRRAFADSKNDELIKEGHDFLHYLVGREEMIDLRTAKKLTIEIESYHLLQGGKPPHLLFLDEGETVAALWSSETMKLHLAGNMDTMQWLIAHTLWILWMDATPTRRGMVWMQELMMLVDRRAICIINDKVLLHHKAYRVKSVRNWLTLLVDKVTAKKRMEIVLGTKKMGDRVWTLLTETYAELQLKVLYYHDGMSAEVKATLKDVNKHWPEYDYVMFTSSILNGIDCYVKNHFHWQASFKAVCRKFIEWCETDELNKDVYKRDKAPGSNLEVSQRLQACY